MARNSCLPQGRDEPVPGREYPGRPRQKSFPEHRLQRQSAANLTPITSKETSKVPPTVVGNSHRQEGTNGLENLSAWRRNALKPDLYHGEDCDTNALNLLWKTKRF